MVVIVMRFVWSGRLVEVFFMKLLGGSYYECWCDDFGVIRNWRWKFGGGGV